MKKKVLNTSKSLKPLHIKDEGSLLPALPCLLLGLLEGPNDKNPCVGAI